MRPENQAERKFPSQKERKKRKEKEKRKTKKIEEERSSEGNEVENQSILRVFSRHRSCLVWAIFALVALHLAHRVNRGKEPFS